MRTVLSCVTRGLAMDGYPVKAVLSYISRLIIPCNRPKVSSVKAKEDIYINFSDNH